MANPASPIVPVVQSIVPAIVTSISGLVGVVLGFILGFFGESYREKRDKNNINAELMRALSQEIGNNRVKCQAISANRDAPAYLESVCWDRIRFSDVLYKCISMRNDDIYQRLIRIYMEIGKINLFVGAHLSALDGVLRGSGQRELPNTTYNTLREEVTKFLPQLTTLETDFREFLIREGFFKLSRHR
jgi:hypothetical protein